MHLLNSSPVLFRFYNSDKFSITFFTITPAAMQERLDFNIMDTYYTIEEKYLQAVNEAVYGETPKGLQLFKEIIESDPFYARAHFQLGKIYFYEIKDYQSAGYHFKTCVELEPLFPDVYYHYLNLVVFLNMVSKIDDIATKALKVPGADTADIYQLLGLFAEKNKNWANALNAYRTAFMEVTCKKQKSDVEVSIDRVKSKIQQGRSYQYYLQD
jgi:tetratricopeptide (TPR) repeat protein